MNSMGRARYRVPQHSLLIAWVAAFACVICLLVLARGSAQAGFNDGSSSFCNRQVVKDYQQSLRRMPFIPSPPASGQLPFAPKATFFELLPGDFLVTLGETVQRAGFAFSVPSGSSRTFHLNWIVEANLVQIDRYGDERQIKRFKTLRLGALTDSALDQIEESVSLRSRPAYYRFEVVFSRPNGKRLGRYGQYIRVVRPKFAARLSADLDSLRAGESLTFRIENFGTERVSYSPSFSLEYLRGSTWVEQPLDVRWPRIILTAAPGEAGGCQTFLVPPETSPGRYRISKSLRGRGRSLTAEFDVVP